MSPNQKYRATFWCSQNATPEFGVQGGAQYNLTQIATKGEYKQYEVLFAPAQANLKIGLNAAAANVAIDELRICPANASMESYSYAPIVGIVATTNGLGRITFFEYDQRGRLVITRNQEGAILEKKDYGIQTTSN